MRRPDQKKMRRNLRTYRPSRMLFLDTETYTREYPFYGDQAARIASEQAGEALGVRIRKSLGPGGINLDTVRRDYGRETVAELRQRSSGLLRRGGVEPDVLAQEWGLTYDGLIQVLLDTPRERELKEQYKRGLESQLEEHVEPERIDEHHRMSMAWTCHVRRRADRPNTVTWRYHNNPYELCCWIDRLARPNTSLYIFGHNIFFDLQVSDFFHYFTKWGWVLDFTYDQGMTYILCIRKGRRSIKALSTTNYFPVSLRELGEMMGLPKLEVDLESASREELSTYCGRDVEICRRAVEYWISFLDGHDLGNFSLTRASQAMTAFRHRFLSADLHIHQDEEIHAFERAAYFGGRTEAFFIGEVPGGPFVSLDVNSMYPYVMRNNFYPTRCLGLSNAPRMDCFASNLEKYCIIAEVEIETQEPVYPVIRESKLIFPVGRFVTHLCTRSLYYAYHSGHIRRIFRAAYYEKGYIFGDYVDFFNRLKMQYGQENNALMRQVTKLFLNSLYGKFGQKRPIMQEEEDITCDGYWKEDVADLVSGQMITVTKLFNKRFATRGYETSKQSAPAIAAHVTDDARLHLWRMIKSIGRHRVLYCDTDSIKIRKADLPYVQAPIDPYQLGALDVEETTDRLVIHGAKDYETDNTVKHKGVPPGARRAPDGRWVYRDWPRQNTHLRAGVSRYYIVREVVKERRSSYDKGIVTPRGTVLPFRLEPPLPAVSPPAAPALSAPPSPRRSPGCGASSPPPA